MSFPWAGVGAHQEKGALAERVDVGPPTHAEVVAVAAPARRGNEDEDELDAAALAR